MTETQTETLYSPSYVAEALGVSAPQVRRWAAALETVTGQPIKQQPRTGRAYTQQQLDVLLQAKRIASAASGMSAETSISIALGQTGMSVPLQRAERGSELPGLAFGPDEARLIADAITEAQKPLLTELQRLTALLEKQGQGLSERTAEGLLTALKPAEAAQRPEGTQQRRGGLVRMAEQVERMIGRWLEREG